MVTLVQGRGFRSEQPELVVDALPLGRHRLRLVVFDSAGNASAPDEVVVEVGRVLQPPPIVVTPPVIVQPPIVRPPIG